MTATEPDCGWRTCARCGVIYDVAAAHDCLALYFSSEPTGWAEERARCQAATGGEEDGE